MKRKTGVPAWGITRDGIKELDGWDGISPQRFYNRTTAKAFQAECPEYSTESGVKYYDRKSVEEYTSQRMAGWTAG